MTTATPIGTLIVDDDYRVSTIHGAYVAKPDGYRSLGRPTPPRRPLAVQTERPDLVLWTRTYPTAVA